jgi:hypothetical protein
LSSVLSLVPSAKAEIVIVGTTENPEVQVTNATGKDLIARLIEVLGVSIRYQDVGKNPIKETRHRTLSTRAFRIFLPTCRHR